MIKNAIAYYYAFLSLLGDLAQQLFDVYNARVTTDSGTMKSETNSVAIYQHLIDNDTYDNSLLVYSGEGGWKLRELGVDKFSTKNYDFTINDNDLVQAAEASQLWQSGNIAPTEKATLKNPNNATRLIGHPEIAFASNEAWSATFVINTFSLQSSSYIAGQLSPPRGFVWEFTSNRIAWRDLSGTFTVLEIGSGLKNASFGKNTIATLAADGSGNLSLSIDGSFIKTSVVDTAMDFDALMFSNFYGLLYFSKIQSEEMITDQITDEATFLRTLYPEIEDVTIGSEDIATSNLEVVVSSDGTAIVEASDDADWATGASRWSYHNNDPAIGSWAGKLYNKAARDVIIANPPSGWHVATESELTTLAASGGNALKVVGTDYWNTTGGTNTTGFSVVGAASRQTDGTFNTLKDTASFWCADSDKALFLNHDDNTATVSASAANEGHAIRLIKD